MWCDYSHACTHTCIPIHAHAHTLLCATRPQWTRAATQAGHALFAYPANTQACLHTHTHTRTHTRMRARMHARAHKHITNTDIHRTLVCHLSTYAHRHTPYAGVSPVNLQRALPAARTIQACPAQQSRQPGRQHAHAARSSEGTEQGAAGLEHR